MFRLYPLFSLQEGKHPLWHASYDGREDLVLLFLEHKAVVDLPTSVRYSTTQTHVHAH
jgi:hypothetical protein